MATARTRADLTFSARCGREPDGVTFAPGRLVLLGEHLDHQGGRVLAIPLKQGVAVAYGLRPDSRIAVWALNAKSKDRFSSGEWHKTGRRWSDFAKGVCARAAQGRRLPGLDLVVFGDLPTRAGLASSAAYLTALFRAVYRVLKVERAPDELAEDVAHVEHEWGGVRCGTMDPYVAAVGEPNRIVYLDCHTLTHETVTLPREIQVGSVDTNVKRALADTPYNERRRELAKALEVVQTERANVKRLVELRPEELSQFEGRLPDRIFRRARHVVTEARRVEGAVEALAARDLETLGRLLVEGHRSLSLDYESTTPEIDAQVEQIVADPSVIGARLSGAGWGGRIIVLRKRSPNDGEGSEANA